MSKSKKPRCKPYKPKAVLLNAHSHTIKGVMTLRKSRLLDCALQCQCAYEDLITGRSKGVDAWFSLTHAYSLGIAFCILDPKEFGEVEHYLQSAQNALAALFYRKANAGTWATRASEREALCLGNDAYEAVLGKASQQQYELAWDYTAHAIACAHKGERWPWKLLCDIGHRLGLKDQDQKALDAVIQPIRRAVELEAA